MNPASMTIAQGTRAPAAAAAPADRRRWIAALSVLVLAAGWGCNSSSDPAPAPVREPALLSCPPGHAPRDGVCVDVSNWVLVVNSAASISLLDTDTGITHGPYLQGQLGSVYALFLDAAVTPDGMTALVTSFVDQRVYFIDLTDLTNPTVLGNVQLDMFAEDVTISPDGEYALVTDGGFSSKIIVIDIQARTVIQEAQDRPVLANAVAIAPGGTILTANYFASGISRDPYGKPLLPEGGMVSTWMLGPEGRLTHANDYRLYLRASGEVTTEPGGHVFRPVNLAVAPDGVTVLVPDVSPYDRDHASTLDPLGAPSAVRAQYAIAVYLITAPGRLTFQGVVAGLPHAVQSIAFSEAGDEAYLLGNGGQEYDPPEGETGQSNDLLMVLRISAPGVVSLDPTRSADLRRITSSQLFGVDNVVARHGKAYASYSSTSVEGSPLRVLSVVDLETLEVKRIATRFTAFDPNDRIVTGLALIPRSEPAALPAGPATCAGFCGTAHGDQSCFCDADCAEWGDCCPDYEALCTSCDVATCTGGQKCVNLPDGTFACGCIPGYQDDGTGVCVDVDECAAEVAVCSPTTTCENGLGTFGCFCPDGFIGDGAGGCQCSYGSRDDGAGGCAAIDRCAENTHSCQAPATCTPLLEGRFTCDCAAPMIQDGFGGCTCPPGQDMDGTGGCVDIDECARGLAACHDGATCRNVADRYYCDCAEPLVEDGTGGCLVVPAPG